MTSLSPAQRELLQQLDVNVETGLTSDEASKRREDAGYFNTVDPPIQCPAWVCCLLPCIKSIPSMKAYNSIKAEDAEVLRDGRWIRYDASSLVKGDIIRMEEGDIVPADCTVLKLEDGVDELLVDHRSITGEDKPRQAKKRGISPVPPLQLFWGGRVALGSCVAVCTAIGPNTMVASRIREHNFPPKESVDEEQGIALMAQQQQPIDSDRMT